MPAGDAVGGDNDHVDMLALYYLQDAPGNVISYFDAAPSFDFPDRKGSMALGQMLFCKCSRRLDEFGFRNQVRKSSCGKKRNDIYKMEFGMKVLSKVRCHLQSRL